MSEFYKVLLVGLDFAGKTSILRILEGNYSDLDQIKPTLGRERTEWDILGFKIINWDLGGQEQYRKEHLTNQVLMDTNLLIYVVDVQDDDRFEEASSYFKDLLEAFEQHTIRCPVLLCIHKLDPNIAEDPELKENLERITDQLSSIAGQYDVEVKVHITSIFDEKSLIEMFSDGISELIPVGILNQILDEFREDVNIPGAILFDINFFVIGDSFKDKTTRNTCYQTINAFITLMRDFKDVYDDNHDINFDIPVVDGDYYKFQLSKITEIGPYYLLIMGSQSIKSKSVLTTFYKKFMPRIDKSLRDLIKSEE